MPHPVNYIFGPNHPFHLQQATWQTLPSYMQESCTLGATAATASTAEAAAVSQPPPPPPATTQGGDNEVRKMSTSSGPATSPEVRDTMSPT